MAPELETQLTSRLHRILCPLPFELGEYALGLSGADEIEKIRSHLAECPLCQADLAMLLDFLAQEDLEDQTHPSDGNES